MKGLLKWKKNKGLFGKNFFPFFSNFVKKRTFAGERSADARRLTFESLEERALLAVLAGFESDALLSEPLATSEIYAADEFKAGEFLLISTTLPEDVPVAELPASLESVNVGESFYLSVWVKNLDGSSNGIAGGYLDLNYASTNVSVTGDYISGVSFSEEVSYSDAETYPGTIEMFGGMAVIPFFYGQENWVMLGAYAFTAETIGMAHFSVSLPSMGGEVIPAGLSRKTDGILDVADIKYGSADLKILGTITDVSVDGYKGDYNGNPHSITLTDPQSATDTISYSYNGHVYTELPTFTDAGTYTVGVTVRRAYHHDWIGSANVVITPAMIAVDGTTVENKVYDGTIGAEITIGSILGIFNEDNVMVIVSGAFESAKVGSYNVNLAYTLIGDDAGNYLVPINDSVSATISAKPLTISQTAPTTVADKNYDGTTVAAVTCGTLSGVEEGDTVTVSAVGTFADPNVGQNKNVTVVYAISGADAGNYITPVNETITASITNADFEVELTGYTGIYDGDAHTISVDGLAEGDTVVYRYNGENFDNAPEFTNVGTYSVSVTVSRANYNDWTGSANVVISQKQLTISGTSVADKTYDGTTAATVTLGTVSGVETGDTVTVSATGTFADPNVGQDKNVTVVYEISGTDAGNYITPVNETITASITNADFEIELTGYTGIYDGDAHTISVAGLLEGDTVVYRYNGESFTSAPEFTNVGTYAISVTVSRANYNDWTGSANVVISQKQLTISGTTVANKTYDGTTDATVTLGTVSDVVTGDTVSVSAVGTFADPNVGQNKNVTVVYAISGADAGNYFTPVNETITASITNADFELELTGYTGIYDGDAHTISVAGLLEGDTVVYRYNGESSTSAPTFTNVGTYAISVTVSRANYDDWTGSADVVISQKQLTISGTTVANKTFDGTTDATITLGTVSGVVTGDAVSVSAFGTFADPNVGQDKNVTVVYAISGADAGNYITPVNETIMASITNADFEVELTGYTGIYDGDAHTISVAGLAEGDTVVYSYNGESFTSAPEFTNVGTYAVSVTVSRANYNDWTGSANVVISQKQLTISGTTVADKTFDGTTDATITLGTVSGVEIGDAVTVSATGTFADPNVGQNKSVTVVYEISGADAGNYITPVNETKTASITNADFEIELTGYTGIYDGDAHTISIDGLLEGDTVVYSYNGESFTSAPEFTKVGTYAISVTVSRANYVDWTGSANVVISQKQLTVSGTTVADKTFDGTTDATITLGTVSGVETGDAVSVSATGTFADPNVGQNKNVTVVYAISGADAGNYITPVSETKTASITNADFEIELTGYTGTYDGDAHTISVDGLAEGDTVVYRYNDENFDNAPEFTNVGTYSVSVTVSRANYSDWTGSANVVISQKQLTISGTSVADKTFDGTTDATVNRGLLSGVVTGDTVSVSAVGTFADPNVGQNKNVTVVYAISGADAGNYITPVSDSALASITNADFEIELTGYTGIYDGDAHTISIDGLLEGDTVVYRYNDESFTSAPEFTNVGTYSVSVTVSRANYNDWTGSANVVISQKQLTVSGTSVANKTYDGTTAATVNRGLLSGVEEGDTVTVSATGTFADPNVGQNKNVTVVYAISGADAGNYITPVSDSALASITNADFEIELTGYTGIYDGDAYTISVAGLLEGDTVVYSYNDESFTSAPEFTKVGTYSISVTVSRANYVDWTGSANVVISQKQLTVSGTTVANKTYDGTTAATVTLGTVSGVVTGETVSVSATGTFADSNVGQDKNVTVVYAISGADAGNYITPVNDSALASITNADFEIELTGYTGIYDGDAHTISVAGLLEGDTVVYSYNGENFDNAPEFTKVGTYAVSVTVSRANYVDWTGSANVVISQKQLTVSGTSVANKTYDGTTVAVITLGRMEGTVDNETVTVTAFGAFGDKNVGDYDITVAYEIDGTGIENYCVPKNDVVKASITSAPLTGIMLDETTPFVGMTLMTTLAPTTDATATYQWYRGDDIIDGANSSYYTILSADLGYTLKVIATGTGNWTGVVEVATSTSVKDELDEITLSNTAPNVGDLLTTTLLPDGATATYQWFLDDVAIPNAIESSYTVMVSDIGGVLKVEAVGTGNYVGTVRAKAAIGTVWQLVTTAEDIMDPNDNLLSLREAIENTNQTPQIKHTIEFDPRVFTSDHRVIQLDSRLGSILVNTSILLNADLGENLSVEITASQAGTAFIVGEGCFVEFQQVFFDGGLVNLGTLAIIGGEYCNTVTRTIQNQQNIQGAVMSNWGSLTLTDVLFKGNRMTTAEIQSDILGGLIYNAGELVVNEMKIENSVIATDGKQSSIYGGVIYNTGTMSIGSLMATGLMVKTSGTQASLYGGLIYNAGTFRLVEGVLKGNHVSTEGIQSYFYGGLVYNAGIMSIENSVVADNIIDAKGVIGYVYGGAVYNRGTLTLADSTITENNVKEGGFITNVQGAGIYNKNELNILNSIIVGNEVRTEADKVRARGDLYNVSGKTMNLAYSVYGTLSGMATESIETVSNKVAAKIFKTNDEGIVYENEIPVILESGGAAGFGTLIGSIEDDYYFVDVASWKSFQKRDEMFPFDPLAVHFGLTNGSVIMASLNGNNRVDDDDLSHFDIGAYAIDYHPALPIMPSAPSANDELDFITPETVCGYARPEKERDALFLAWNDDSL